MGPVPPRGRPSSPVRGMATSVAEPTITARRASSASSCATTSAATIVMLSCPPAALAAWAGGLDGGAEVQVGEDHADGDVVDHAAQAVGAEHDPVAEVGVEDLGSGSKSIRPFSTLR